MICHSWGFYITLRHTTVGRTPLDEWSARRKASTCQHTTLTRNRYPWPGGIRTHNLNRREAADLRLRLRGYWDRPTNIPGTNFKVYLLRDAPTSLTLIIFTNSTFCPHLFMCFVLIWEQTLTCATYITNLLVFITEMKGVYSAVRTGYLNKAVSTSSLKG
jgi:hypothetical protein